MEHGNDALIYLAEGALALLAIAFMAWAGVVWNSAKQVRLALEEMHKELNSKLEAQADDFHDYRLDLERRLAKVEVKLFNGDIK